jgi:hypothetical protein
MSSYVFGGGNVSCVGSGGGDIDVENQSYCNTFTNNNI